jgi:L-lysine 6-transaminase
LSVTIDYTPTMMNPTEVHETLSRHQLVDGFGMVLDLERSHGSWLHDAVTSEDFLDFFTCFASWPLGYDHPAMMDPDFRAEIELVARNKPSNSDLYTTHMAEFVECFAGRVTPPGFPYHFWISGGALAVENGLKTAFDWKARKIGLEAADDGNNLVVLHFRQAFHGRSGYTLSLTNTVPDKIALFPKFPWPRVHNPAVEFDLDGGIANDIESEERRACDEIEAVFREHAGLVAAITIEPMQGEGGDNHFRPEFLAKLRTYADEHEALLIYDEVQTGFYGSGKAWLWQHYDVPPDIACFGKKTQVCGIYASRRLDEVEDHVFKKSSRINSTWGGNLVDMVRCRKFIEIIQEENLAENVFQRGAQLVLGLRELAREGRPMSNVRGIGSLVAFTLETPEVRDRLLGDLAANRLLALASGPRSIRFRLPLVVTEEEIQTAMGRIADCVARL